jgi:methionyl-tRNA formyltransferase
MNKPGILFIGTPSFAIPALDILHTRNYPLIGVVTQPDRSQGRGQKKIAPPVKTFAQKLGLPIFQPENINEQSFIDLFKKLNPKMVVVAAFGKILPKVIIDFPPLGCLNIHPSLLPKYRGAAPINWAIINGETKTGVTIIHMDEGMDSGNIILQNETVISANENYGQLHDRLATQGAVLLIAAIEQMLAGNLTDRAQNLSLVTFAPRLTKETGRINWHADISDIVNLIRGLSPIPAAYTILEGQLLKIYAAEPKPGKGDNIPGTIGIITTEGIPIAAKNGYVLLKELQLAGKKKMPASAFLRGYRLNPNVILGS